MSVLRVRWVCALASSIVAFLLSGLSCTTSTEKVEPTVSEPARVEVLESADEDNEASGGFDTSNVDNHAARVESDLEQVTDDEMRETNEGSKADIVEEAIPEAEKTDTSDKAANLDYS